MKSAANIKMLFLNYSSNIKLYFLYISHLKYFWLFIKTSVDRKMFGKNFVFCLFEYKTKYVPTFEVKA